MSRCGKTRGRRKGIGPFKERKERGFVDERKKVKNTVIIVFILDRERGTWYNRVGWGKGRERNSDGMNRRSLCRVCAEGQGRPRGSGRKVSAIETC